MLTQFWRAVTIVYYIQNSFASGLHPEVLETGTIINLT